MQPSRAVSEDVADVEAAIHIHLSCGDNQQRGLGRTIIMKHRQFKACAWLVSLFGLTFMLNMLVRVFRQSHGHAMKRTVFDFSLDSLDRLGSKIIARQDLTAKCGARLFGSGFGHHMLCTRPRPVRPCYFYSFGISRDYSFDSDFANSTACVGVAADPTVTYPSTIHRGVYFTQMAASSYDPEDTAMFPLRTSVPGLRLTLKHERLSVLKMDCEGCEYALARDILDEDPNFFNHVDNFVVEIHYSKRWMKSNSHLYSLAALMHLLEEAGMELVHFELSGCSAEARATGIMPELKSLKLAPSLNLHCHNYLFARLE
jgi:hypothetical protein